MTGIVERIAETVLYEGYVLWPYRRSAIKNRQRWTFGGVFPAGWTAEHPDDPSALVAECLVEGGDGAAVEVQVRFLQVVERRVSELDGDGRLREVDALDAGGQRHLSWEEATERKLAVASTALPGLRAGLRRDVTVHADSEREWLEASGGARAGALDRSWEGLGARVEVTAESLGGDLDRVRVRIVNTTPWQGDARADALRRALVSTHAVLRVQDGAFTSLTDPPDRLRDAAAGCRTQGLWPVLVGAPGERHTLLTSPIVLPDHPEVAPESPGDLFDATEIDQLLILNVLALSEAEQAEARASDPRARAILDRCAGLSRDDLMGLHGKLRDAGPGGWR